MRTESARFGMTADRAGGIAVRVSPDRGFAVPFDRAGLPTPSAPPATATTATLGVASLGLVASLASDDAAARAERTRRAVRRGADLLALLARLQRSVLAGGAEGAVLDELERLAAGSVPVEDPGLASLLTDIETRVQVEIARRRPRRSAAG